jgi:Tfp pilus assembly protein PilN
MGAPNQLSFLPDDYLDRKAQRRTNALCALLFMSVMGGIGTVFYLSEQATQRVDAEYARVEEQYLSEAKRIEQVKEMQDKQKRMAHQAEMTASLLERIPRSYILAEITNALPAGVSLLDLTMDSKAKAKPVETGTKKTAYEQRKAAKGAAAAVTAAAPEARTYDVTLKLTGMAGTDEHVARFMEKLSLHELFSEVNLPITQEHKQGEDNLRKFQMEMTLNQKAEVRPDDKPQTASVELEEKP